MHGASHADAAQVVRHAGARAFDLVGMFAAQLLNHFINLTHASGTDRMAFGQQTAAGIDDDIALHAGAPLGRPMTALTAGHQAQVFAVNDFRDGKTIVQFDQIDIRSLQARLGIGLLRGQHGGIIRAQIRVVRNTR